MKIYELPSEVITDIDNLYDNVSDERAFEIGSTNILEEEAKLLIAAFHIKKAFTALYEASEIVVENETDQEFTDKYALLTQALLDVMKTEDKDSIINETNLKQAIIIESIVDNNTEY